MRLSTEKSNGKGHHHHAAQRSLLTASPVHFTEPALVSWVNSSSKGRTHSLLYFPSLSVVSWECGLSRDEDRWIQDVPVVKWKSSDVMLYRRSVVSYQSLRKTCQNPLGSLSGTCRPNNGTSDRWIQLTKARSLSLTMGALGVGLRGLESIVNPALLESSSELFLANLFYFLLYLTILATYLNLWAFIFL